MDAEKIGEVIRRHRKASKLNRIECARLAGVGKTVIYDIEHGKASVQLDTVLKIFKVFNISMSLSSPYMDASRPDLHTSHP